MTQLLDWSEMHCETNMNNKEVRAKKTDTVNWFVDDNLDYEILIESTLYMDGSFDHEVLDQYIIHLDDEGNIQNSVPAVLPEKYRREAIEQMEERLRY